VIRDAGKPAREAAKRVRERLHFRRDGMVTVCGVQLDSVTERKARFTDDIGTLRRASGVCEVCVKESSR
jgi:hypothetical protein